MYRVCFSKSLEIGKNKCLSYFEKDKLKTPLPLSYSKKKERTCEENVGGWSRTVGV
jgi:hypothetical protein